MNNEIRYYLTQVDYYPSIDYAIVKLSDTNWVACWNPRIMTDLNKGEYFTCWSQGHYFENKEDTYNYVQEMFKWKIYHKLTEQEEISLELQQLFKEYTECKY